LIVLLKSIVHVALWQIMYLYKTCD